MIYAHVSRLNILVNVISNLVKSYPLWNVSWLLQLHSVLQLKGWDSELEYLEVKE